MASQHNEPCHKITPFSCQNILKLLISSKMTKHDIPEMVRSSKIFDSRNNVNVTDIK